LELLDESLRLIGVGFGVAVGHRGHGAVSLEMFNGLLGQPQLLQQLLLHGDAVLVGVFTNDFIRGSQVEGHPRITAALDDELDHLTPVVVRLKDVRVADDDQQSLGPRDGNIEPLK
jgi:hypothetical protein